MLRSNLPRAVRHLRRRHGWRQVDLAVRTSVSRQVLSRIERGELRGVSLGTVARVSEGLGAAVDLTVRWRGEELDRLMDSAHAELVSACIRLLTERGWLTRVEVSFNHYGDRGRVDVLGFHPTTRTLLVVEVKSAIGNEQETLGRIDVKARLGATIAATVGWEPAAVVPALVMGDSRTARRIVGGHAAAFTRFDVRGRQAMAWLRRPASQMPKGLLWFVKVPDSRGMSVTRHARVRTTKTPR